MSQTQGRGMMCNCTNKGTFTVHYCHIKKESKDA